MIEYYRAKNEEVDIDIVAYGPGLHMLRADTSPVQDRIKRMKDMVFPGKIQFSACNNTKQSMEKTEGHAISIVAGRDHRSFRRGAPQRVAGAGLELREAVTIKLTMRTITITAALTLGAQAAFADDSATVTYKSLSPEVALEAAQAALKQCRSNGFQVAVAVVDRFGQPQVMLRDRYAGLPAADTATSKAYTALSFHAATSDLAKSIKSRHDGFGPRAVCRTSPCWPAGW